MSSLNQQIGEELGYFIGTEEEDLTGGPILVYVCKPDCSYRDLAYGLPPEQSQWDYLHAVLEEEYGDLIEYCWTYLPDWQEDLQLAIELVEDFSGSAGWEIQTALSRFFKYSAKVKLEDSREVRAYSFQYGNTPTEALCTAWLDAYRDYQLDLKMINAEHPNESL